MFALIGMIVVTLWVLRFLVDMSIAYLLGREQARERLILNAILSGQLTLKQAARCDCCGHEKCIYRA